ncbi:MAG: hypothetical protein KY392_01370 [Chloroflexi bacterium]|nr:hypothetical protein [Chloroflexota bacterium]
MTGLHAAAWPLLGVALLGLAGVSATAAMRNRAPATLELLRRGALVLLVGQAAIGLALAVRGSGPSELLHWIYGVVVIAVLLVPGAMTEDRPPAARSWALAAGSVVGAILVWRLGASG